MKGRNFVGEQLQNRGLYLGAVVSLVTAASFMLAAIQVADAQSVSTEWSFPTDISAPVTEGDDLFGELVCDPHQNLHVLWGKSHDNGSEIYYRTDAAGSLSDPLDVLALSDPLALRLSAAVLEYDNSLHLIWQNDYFRGDLSYSRVALSNALDVRAWKEPVLLATEVDSAVLIPYEGNLYLVYGASDEQGYGSSIYFLQSKDGGDTWSEPSLIHRFHAPVPSFVSSSVAIDEAGRIHIGITLRSREDVLYSEVGYVRSLDGGRTWGSYQVIAAQDESTPNVSLIVPFAFGDDEVHLTWHDPRRMHMWSADGGSSWSQPIEIMELGAGFGSANLVAEDSAGHLYAALGVKNGFYVAEWDGSEWTRYAQVENRSMDPHGGDLIVCQGNQLHLVYDDRVEQDTTVWYAHRQVPAPHIARSPLPTSQPRTESTLAARASVTSQPTIAVEQPTLPPGAVADSRPVVDSRPALPLLTATASVTALLIVALGVLGIGSWRR